MTIRDSIYMITFVFILVALFPVADPAMTSGDWPVTPYDRCMASFEGSPYAEQCALLLD